MAIGDDILAGTIGCLFAAVVGSFILLLFYGAIVILFRYAFGVELPNPFDFLPADWQKKSPRRKPDRRSQNSIGLGGLTVPGRLLW